MKCKKESMGFTMIELMVVISIIAILASLLLPALMKAKELTLRTNCVSNHKQIALAYNMYSYDYAWLIPGGVSSTGDNWNKNPVTWAYKLLPYSNAHVFACPSRTEKNVLNWHPLDQADDEPISIGINAQLGDPTYGVVKLEMVKNPSKTVITDEFGFWTDYAGSFYYWTQQGFPKQSSDWVIPHTGNTYVCPMIDGHVETLGYLFLKEKRIEYCDPRY